MDRVRPVRGCKELLHRSFYHMIHLIDLEPVLNKIIQARAGDQRLYIVNAVQKIF